MTCRYGPTAAGSTETRLRAICSSMPVSLSTPRNMAAAMMMPAIDRALGAWRRRTLDWEWESGKLISSARVVAMRKVGAGGRRPASRMTRATSTTATLATVQAVPVR